MPYVSQFIRPVFIVRWTSPQVGDIARVSTEFTRAYEENGGPVSYLAIVPQDCEPPDDAARGAMIRGRDDVLDRCITMHIVMEGEGFKHAILRNAFAAMQLFGNKRDKVFVHRNTEEALTDASRRALPRVKLDVPNVLAKGQASGVFTVVKSDRFGRRP